MQNEVDEASILTASKELVQFIDAFELYLPLYPLFYKSRKQIVDRLICLCNLVPHPFANVDSVFAEYLVLQQVINTRNCE